MPVPALYQDPFAPVLLSSTPLDVSLEQRDFIKLILDKACSDSRFADKAYLAIVRVLTAEPAVIPVVDSLSPDNATIGDESFDVHVIGSGFTPDSTIYFNGIEEPTTFNSEGDIHTGVNMPLWVGPDAVPVTVRSKEGVISNSVLFTFNSPVSREGEEKKAKVGVELNPSLKPVSQGSQTTQDPAMPEPLTTKVPPGTPPATSPGKQ
jgi:hypothetical protein